MTPDSVWTILTHRPSAYLQHGGGVDWLEFAEQLTHSPAIPQGEGRWVGVEMLAGFRLTT